MPIVCNTKKDRPGGLSHLYLRRWTYRFLGWSDSSAVSIRFTEPPEPTHWSTISPFAATREVGGDTLDTHDLVHGAVVGLPALRPGNRELREILAEGLERFVAGHTQDIEACARLLVEQLFQQRHLPPAWAAVGIPEFDQREIAGSVAECVSLAFEIGEGNVGHEACQFLEDDRSARESLSFSVTNAPCGST